MYTYLPQRLAVSCIPTTTSTTTSDCRTGSSWSTFLFSLILISVIGMYLSMYVCMDRWMDGCTSSTTTADCRTGSSWSTILFFLILISVIGMYLWMDGWMDRWMDGCMYVCMYGWMDVPAGVRPFTDPRLHLCMYGMYVCIYVYQSSLPSLHLHQSRISLLLLLLLLLLLGRRDR